MENEYAQLIEVTQSFIDLLPHAHDGEDAADDDEPRVERIDFDRLRELLGTVREKLDDARRAEGESRRIRRRLAVRIDALRRGGNILAGNGRPTDDAYPADEASLDELIRMLEEETARLHRGAATSERMMQDARRTHRHYDEFK